jgi:hypothetical protein
MSRTKIAILGWGSLLWERHSEFDEQRDEWQGSGPSLKLEFSRVSSTRRGALTLVYDCVNGSECIVNFAYSKRTMPEDAIADLRCREGTTLQNIGFLFRGGARQHGNCEEMLEVVRAWIAPTEIDVVIWTALESNFAQKSKIGKPFSVESALAHLQALDPEGKAKAAEYVWRAPDLVDTPLRRALTCAPWFAPNATRASPV